MHGLDLPGGFKGDKFDYFHEMIITQEMARIGARGYSDGLLGGMVIGLPPVMSALTSYLLFWFRFAKLRWLALT